MGIHAGPHPFSVGGRLDLLACDEAGRLNRCEEAIGDLLRDELEEFWRLVARTGVVTAKGRGDGVDRLILHEDERTVGLVLRMHRGSFLHNSTRSGLTMDSMVYCS